MANRNSKSSSAKSTARKGRNTQRATLSQNTLDAEFAATSKLARAVEAMMKAAESDQSLIRLEFASELGHLIDAYEARIMAIEQRQ